MGKRLRKTLAGRDVDLDHVRRELAELFPWIPNVSCTSYAQSVSEGARPLATNPQNWPRNLVAQMPGLAELAEVKRQAEVSRRVIMRWRAKLSAADEIHITTFLYGGILRIWTDVIGGKLGVSHPSPAKGGSSPYGPLVRYFRRLCGANLGRSDAGPPRHRSHR